jgi:hypothetical protein
MWLSALVINRVERLTIVFKLEINETEDAVSLISFIAIRGQSESSINKIWINKIVPLLAIFVKNTKE